MNRGVVHNDVIYRLQLSDLQSSLYLVGCVKEYQNKGNLIVLGVVGVKVLQMNE